MKKLLSTVMPNWRTGTASRAKAATVVVMVFVFGAASIAATLNIFKPFRNDAGTVQSATADPSVLNGTNAFFDHSIGNNGQACSTCHEPDQSFGLSVDFMRQQFINTLFQPQLDEIFRLNDTADRPDAPEGTPLERVRAYRLALELGTTRIARPVPADADFIATLEGASTSPAYSEQFGYLPKNNDPQNPGNMLSLFRRPLVNTNVHFDSAVLWDGREDVTSMPLQTTRAFKTLLLKPGLDPAIAAEVSNFMLGVFTAQETLDGAGSLKGAGATGGVDALLAHAQTYGPLICNATAPQNCPVVLGQPSFNLFDAWANLPDTPSNSLRRSIARGQEVFNSAVLHRPPDLAALPAFANIGPAPDFEMHCTTCHAVPNVGTNPYSVFLGRLGTDSVQILTHLRDSRPDLPSLRDFVERLKKLPQYCFRSKDPDAPPLSEVPCGQFAGNADAPGDVLSTDPGRALNGRPGSAKLELIGRFKPAGLRGLAGRAPYFHQGGATDIDALIDFYDARFNIHLTPQQHADLKAFLDAL